jgi:hypothetical protein
MSLRVYYEVLNQRGTPALFTDTFANRPAFGFQGRLFISTDTAQIFEDTGTAWILIADGGTSSLNLQQVTTNGNTTTLGITVQGIDINDGAGTGANNMAIGSSALANNTIGISNTAVGFVALGNNTTGGGNVGVGFNALQFNTTGGNNTAIGYNALQNSTASQNTAVGNLSLNTNTTGANSTAVGNQALQLNTTGSNTAVGSAALSNNTTGTGNTAIGISAGGSITTGSNNTILGNYIGTSTLANNIVLADGSGNIRYQFDGTNNVFGANVIAPQVRASTSAGLSINANSGTQVADFGAGGSANLTLFGGLSGTTASFLNSSASTGLDVASDKVIFRANTGVATPRQVEISMGGATSTFLDAKGFGADYITDFGIRTYNSVGTAFNVFYGTSAGNVIVGGTTDAGFRLDVNGTARVSGGITQTMGTSSINLTNGATYQTSDRGILIGSGTYNNASVVGVAIGQLFNLGTGTGNVAIGFSANASGGSIAISSSGNSAVASGGGIAIGATASSTGGIALKGVTSNNGAVAIGVNSQATQGSAIAIGVSVTVAGQNSVAIGDRAVIAAGHQGSIALGLYATTTASKQLVIGGNDSGGSNAITDVYIGGGVQNFVTADPQTVVINATGGNNSTDRNGGNIAIAGGKGTGAGTPGSVIFSTSTATTSGTTLQTLTERMQVFGGTGNVAINSNIDNGQGKLQVSGNIYVTGIGAAGSTYSVSSTLSTAYYHVFTGAAGQTLTLPSPASNNVQYVIINNTANTVDVAAATSTNIVTTVGTSVASITLIANQRVFIIANGGTNYFQIF